VSKIEQLEVEDLNNSASKRKCRYVGTYDIEKQLSVLLDEQSGTEEEHPENVTKNGKNESLDISGIQKMSPETSQALDNNNSSEFGEKLQNFKTFVIKKGKNEKRSRVRQLSDTSSDEEEITEELDLSVKFPMCLIERCDEQVNISSKSLCSPEKPQTSNGIIKNRQIMKAVLEKPQTSKEIIKNHQVPKAVIEKPQKGKDCKVLKSIFENSTSFDEAMQKYSERKQEQNMMKKIVKPKVIPPPEQDPAIKKNIKKKPTIKANGIKNDESNPNKHLGGIFTINNGWDKQEIKKIEVEDEIRNENVNKLERHITPPNIVIDTNLEDVMAAHDEFMYNEGFLDNLIVSQDSKTSLSTASSHGLQIALSGDKLAEDNSFKGRKINSSLNSSEDDSENDEIVKPPKKIQKLSYSDDEDDDEKELEKENENIHNDTDVVSLFADAG